MTSDGGGGRSKEHAGVHVAGAVRGRRGGPAQRSLHPRGGGVPDARWRAPVSRRHHGSAATAFRGGEPTASRRGGCSCSGAGGGAACARQGGSGPLCRCAGVRCWPRRSRWRAAPPFSGICASVRSSPSTGAAGPARLPDQRVTPKRRAMPPVPRLGSYRRASVCRDQPRDQRQRREEHAELRRPVPARWRADGAGAARGYGTRAAHARSRRWRSRRAVRCCCRLVQYWQRWV